MCIVIDTNVFQRVFDITNMDHSNYSVIRDWIYSGKGKIVFGGSTYSKENIVSSRRNRSLLAVLKSLDKVHEADSKIVDEHEIRIKNMINKADFDDPHIAAIICTCGCKLVATWDKNSLKYLNLAKIYKGHSDVPKFYLSERNADLLVDKNIADCCTPSKKTTKAQKEKLKGL